jgi:hypothetical protein
VSNIAKHLVKIVIMSLLFLVDDLFRSNQGFI